jgi:hypothetical protein
MGIPYPLGGPRHRHGTPWFVAEPAPAPTPGPRLLDRLHEAIRARHLSRRTEEAYRHWIRRDLFFHPLRHPGEMGEAEIERLPDASVGPGAGQRLHPEPGPCGAAVP